MEFNLFTIIATLVNFVILMFVLKRILFDRVNAMIDSRNAETLANITSAEDKLREADALKLTYEKDLAELEEKGRDIVRESKAKADAHAKEIIQEAEAKTAALIKQAELEIERMKKKALADMKDEVGALAIFAAEKILEKQLDHKEQQAVIGRILDETGSVQWQN